MSQVLVRQPMLNGDNKMLKAEVLSQTGDKLRVKIEGQREPKEVNASDVVSAIKVFGPSQRDQRQSVIPKCYPTSVNALGNTLNR